ncbi:hypothetical protein L2E82_03216 [Cichorium intybus]|uniref:Uncharacterized protein n=1 Tax=Cichorium intybus TaxID=13427 RepID=A0ACB9H435_CICIN|nr:hypothetical protein L2E82_03216 [Cichorium intybus]
MRFLFAVSSGRSVTSGFRIVVAGDLGTGKSSLINTAATGSIPPIAPLVLSLTFEFQQPTTRLPQDMFDYNVPITAVDTSSSLEDRDKLVNELKRADAIVLTYACDATFDRLTTFWLPYLQQLEVKAPVVVAGCKVKCFYGPLPIVDVQRTIEHPNLTWNILRTFDYNNDIRLRYDRLVRPIERTPDQSVELTSEAMKFLKRVFFWFDIDGDRAFNAIELDYVFSAARESPWNEAPLVEMKALGGLSLNGFLSK